MGKLAVVAFPNSSAKLIYSTDDFQQVETDNSRMCWGENIVQNVREMVEEKPLVNEVIFFGPRDYVQKFIDELDDLKIKVILGEM